MKADPKPGGEPDLGARRVRVGSRADSCHLGTDEPTIHPVLGRDGNRHPDKKPDRSRKGRDWFALGGILVRGEDNAAARQLVSDFGDRPGPPSSVVEISVARLAFPEHRRGSTRNNLRRTPNGTRQGHRLWPDNRAVAQALLSARSDFSSKNSTAEPGHAIGGSCADVRLD